MSINIHNEGGGAAPCCCLAPSCAALQLLQEHQQLQPTARALLYNILFSYYSECVPDRCQLDFVYRMQLPTPSSVLLLSAGYSEQHVFFSALLMSQPEGCTACCLPPHLPPEAGPPTTQPRPYIGYFAGVVQHLSLFNTTEVSKAFTPAS